MENRNFGGFVLGDNDEKINIYPSNAGEAKEIAEIEQKSHPGAIYIKPDGTITSRPCGYYPTPETGEDTEGETIDHPILISEAERAEDISADEIDRRYNEITNGRGWIESGEIRWEVADKSIAFAIWRGVKIRFIAWIEWGLSRNKWAQKIEAEIESSRESFYSATGLYINENEWAKIAGMARAWLFERYEEEERAEEEREREMEKRLDEKYGE